MGNEVSSKLPSNADGKGEHVFILFLFVEVVNMQSAKVGLSSTNATTTTTADKTRTGKWKSLRGAIHATSQFRRPVKPFVETDNVLHGQLYQHYNKACSVKKSERISAVQKETLVYVRQMFWPSPPEASNVYVQPVALAILERAIAESLPQKSTTHPLPP